MINGFWNSNIMILKRVVNLFPPTPKTLFLDFQKKFTCLISREGAQKRDPHKYIRARDKKFRQEKEHKPKLLGPDIFRWGEGLPREWVGVKRFSNYCNGLQDYNWKPRGDLVCDPLWSNGILQEPPPPRTPHSRFPSKDSVLTVIWGPICALIGLLRFRTSPKVIT